MKTTTPKANATLSAELKRLGFRRGIASWDKSDFEKRIHSDRKDGEQILVKVTIDSEWRPIRQPKHWGVRTVSVATQRLDGNFSTVNSSVLDDGNMLKELSQTLEALEALKIVDF